MAHRLRVGLTGGIASGKSTAAARFRALGVPVIDADESARNVVAPGTPGLAAVVKRFGAHVLNEKGGLDRSAMRDLVFADPVSRSSLESILHPLIRDDMEQRIDNSLGLYVVLEIPLLLEGNSRDRVDRILVVDAPENIQLQRVRRRDGGTEAQASAIMAAQVSRETRLKAADDVLSNVGTVAQLCRSVDAIHAFYLNLAVPASR